MPATDEVFEQVVKEGARRRRVRERVRYLVIASVSIVALGAATALFTSGDKGDRSIVTAASNPLTRQRSQQSSAAPPQSLDSAVGDASSDEGSPSTSSGGAPPIGGTIPCEPDALLSAALSSGYVAQDRPWTMTRVRCIDEWAFAVIQDSENPGLAAESYFEFHDSAWQLLVLGNGSDDPPPGVPPDIAARLRA